MPSSWPLIEHCLPFGKEALGLHGIRNIHRVFAGKASVTETRVFALNCLVKALNRNKRKRITADEIAHFLIGHVCRDKLILRVGINTVEARPTGFR